MGVGKWILIKKDLIRVQAFVISVWGWVFLG